MNVNKHGRMYQPGMALDGELRRLIIDHCLRCGGEPISGYLPVSFTSVTRLINVTANTVSKIWRYFCFHQRQTDPLPSGGDRHSKLSDGDLELIELLKRIERINTTLGVIFCVQEVDDVGNISLSVISKAIKSKRITHACGCRTFHW